jgi:hypothetical protein
MSGDANDAAAYHREMQRLYALRGPAMSDRAVTPWQRERRYQERLQRSHDERRTVRPRFTPAQARAALEYLDAKYETEPQGTTLRCFRHELLDAIERAASDAKAPE